MLDDGLCCGRERIRPIRRDANGATRLGKPGTIAARAMGSSAGWVATQLRCPHRDPAGHAREELSNAGPVAANAGYQGTSNPFETATSSSEHYSLETSRRIARTPPEHPHESHTPAVPHTREGGARRSFAALPLRIRSVERFQSPLPRPRCSLWRPRSDCDRSISRSRLLCSRLPSSLSRELALL